MSWFGGGSSSDDNKSSSSFDEGRSFSGGDFGAPLGSGGASGGGSGRAGGMTMGGGGSFEQELAMEQQKAMVQAVMFKMTEMSFDKCITKPSTSLSSSEKSCIKSVVSKYLDSSEFVIGRFSGGK
jgi:hypothetical protein